MTKMGNNAFVKVLKIAPFRNLWLSQLTSQVFLNLLLFSLIMRTYELTWSNSAVSVLVLLVTIPNIVLGALAGVLVDRWGRKSVMFFSHFLRVFAVLAFLLSPETLGWIYTLTFLISIITQFFFPAEAGTIYQLVKDKQLLLTANSLFSVTFFASVIAGNVLAGPALLWLGPTKTFLLVAGAFLAASFFTARLPGNGTPRLTSLKVTLPGVISDFMAGLDYLYHEPIVRRGIYLLGLSQITIGILGTIAPGFADQILGVSVTDISVLIMAPAAIGMISGALLLGQFLGKTSRQSLIRMGIGTAAVVLILYGLVDKVAFLFHLPTAAVGFVFLLFLGFANACLDIPANTLIQEHTPEAIRSRVYGVISSVIGFCAVLPIIVSGALADVAGVRVVMITTGVLVAAFAVYNYNNRQ